MPPPTHLAGPIVRIAMRYISGAMVSWGMLSQQTGASISTDRDLESVLIFVVGALMGLAAEVYFRISIARGWSH